jgi:mono/diheme cytochrome c family protein
LPDGKPATDAEVEQVLMTGKGMMPSFAYQMSKEQMDAVVDYLHTGLGDQQKQ